MSTIPDDIKKAGRRVYDELGRGSVSDSERIMRAILSERRETARRCVALIRDERLTDETGEPEDIAYNNALTTIEAALEREFLEGAGG